MSTFRPSSILGKKKQDEEAILKSYKSYTETDDTSEPAAAPPPQTIGFEGVQADGAAAANPQEIELTENQDGPPNDKEDQPLHEGTPLLKNKMHVSYQLIVCSSSVGVILANMNER
ncbi:uncharacterized protein LOC135157959 [Lytechinus pictus]|uniref:uncharacterized protein LOC135157959 n=1 Tax=Lytechinus pictus TaxID=7653 RepID=UPI0030B9E78E